MRVFPPYLPVSCAFKCVPNGAVARQVTCYTCRRGNEHLFKDIRRKVGSNPTTATSPGSSREMDKLLTDFEELRWLF